MHHFFVPASAISGDHVEFPEQTGRQIQRVLRLVEGDTVMVLDNSGWMYETGLAFQEQLVRGRIIRKFEADTEPSVKICLMACVSQREKYEWILQKGTELGVTEFLPVISQRTLVQKAGQIEKKRLRWELILKEAAEQSHRGKLPILLPVKQFEDCLSGVDEDTCNLIAHTSDAGLLRSELNQYSGNRYNLLIGPEGGFTETEMEQALEAGFHVISLGKRILRMETAALALVNAVIYHSSID